MSDSTHAFGGPRPPGWTDSEEQHAAAFAALTDAVIDGKREEKDLVGEVVSCCDMAPDKAGEYAALMLHFRRKVRGL